MGHAGRNINLSVRMEHAYLIYTDAIRKKTVKMERMKRSARQCVL